jgi:hypothetical protein
MVIGLSRFLPRSKYSQGEAPLMVLSELAFV